MSGYILRENDPGIVLTADQVDRLVKNGDGDAALLYLLLMRADRGITEQELQSRLRWSQLRLNAAETGLQRLGLIQRPAETPPPGRRAVPGSIIWVPASAGLLLAQKIVLDLCAAPEEHL